MSSSSAPSGRPSDIPEDEWRVRCDLAALYRLVAHFRMTDLIDTHISARVPGSESYFLLNRYGVLFEDMRASDLVKVDDQGNLVDGRTVDEHGWQADVNKAGFVIHSAIHMARHDLNCVIHTHTSAGIAVSAQEAGLLPISQHALKFYGRLAYHDYEGIALDYPERERLVADLGPHKAMILRNHGLLVGGRTIAEAFDHIYTLERACQAQVHALAAGARLRKPSVDVCVRTAMQFDSPDALAYYDFKWASALSLLESGDNDWRR